MESIEWLDQVIQQEKPDRVYVDLGAGGGGPALISGLRARRRQYAETVIGVNFGGTSQAKLANPKRPGPKNRRAEMWWRMASGSPATKGCKSLTSPSCSPT